MSCNKAMGYSINKGEIYRLASDLDGFPNESRRGDDGETHYFIVLSHFRYNQRVSKKSFLAVGISKNQQWDYREDLIPREHFANWDHAVIKNGYYDRFFEFSEIYFQADKLVRLCQESIESFKSAKPALSLSTKGLQKVIECVYGFIKKENDDEN